MRKIIFGLLFIASNALATVDMKNANFTDEWVHLKVPTTGFELNVISNYNSRTLHNGIFGFGWCSDFETDLVKLGSSLKIQVCGAGSETLFYPDGFNKKDLNQQISKIISAYKKSSSGLSAKAEKELIADLQTNPKRRAELSEKFSLTPPISANQKYVAETNSLDIIIFKGNSYLRQRPDGVVETYDSVGKLREKKDTNGNFLQYKYSGKNLSQILNQSGQQLSFTYTSNDKVETVTGPSGLKASFKYKGSDLIYVMNAWKNAYSFEYDDLHNLVKISYPDKTTRELKYDQKRDWVIGFKDREGCVETYDYQFNKANPRDHYWTVLQKKCGSELVNNSRFEFWFKDRVPSGKYLARVRTVINSKVKDVTYHPELSRPVRVEEDGKVNQFAYYSNGLIRSKTENGQASTFKYDAKTKKIIEVQTGNLKSKFSYDKRGNLVFASNSNGQKVKLVYDRNGRIAGLVDHAKRVVNIKYSSTLGKPTSIDRPGIGSINVVYDSTGNIKKVDSNAGPAVAVQVASAFNNLLEIVKPAGVELGL